MLMGSDKLSILSFSHDLNSSSDYIKMAEAKVDEKELVNKFQEFCSLAGSKDKTLMTSKASGKLVADCLEKNYKQYDIKSICDASVFSACKEKGKP